ncbi:MAG: AAA family ATPase [Gammaproteobacteria bacterium]|nr:AAA family ATPase [Gammaproteobacteria bacterium]
MAKIIPENIDLSTVSSEKTFLRALERFTPDNWIAYHNFNFLDLEDGNPKRSKTLKQGEADVVLFIPNQGFIVIEVKGGGIEYSNNNWFSIDRYNDSHSIKNPFEQARKAQHFIAKTCNKVTSEKFVNGYAVCFPDLTIQPEVTLPVDAPAQVVMTKQTLTIDKLEKNILTLFQCWKRSTSLSNQGSKLIQQKVLQPAFRLIPQLSLQHEQDKQKLLQLTQQQYQILDLIQNHQHAIIEGGAGTGKTLLVVEKARRLAAENKKILILTFNLRLARVIKESFFNHHLVEVRTIHKLSEKLCKKAGIPYDVPDNEEELGNFYNHTSVELLSEAAEKADIKFDAILVDEAQDFEDHWWLAITDLLVSESPTESWLYIFYDQNQNIFHRHFKFPIDEKNVYRLTSNCRNTSQIAKWLNEHFSYSAKANSMAPDGDAVEIVRWKNNSDQNDKLKEIINALKNRNVDLDDVVILSAFKSENSGITVPDGIEFTTIPKYKGLEKSVVIVVDIQADKKFSLREDFIYTAASRAVSKLVLLIKKGDLPEYLN